MPDNHTGDCVIISSAASAGADPPVLRPLTVGDVSVLRGWVADPREAHFWRKQAAVLTEELLHDELQGRLAADLLHVVAADGRGEPPWGWYFAHSYRGGAVQSCRLGGYTRPERRGKPASILAAVAFVDCVFFGLRAPVRQVTVDAFEPRSVRLFDLLGLQREPPQGGQRWGSRPCNDVTHFALRRDEWDTLRSRRLGVPRATLSVPM